MDFTGQKLAEWLYMIIIVVGTSVSFLAGYVQSNFVVTLYGWVGTMALAFLVSLPDYPMYSSEDRKFVSELPDADRAYYLGEDDSDEVDEDKGKSKKSKQSKKGGKPDGAKSGKGRSKGKKSGSKKGQPS